jgi:glycosyltransferase involved in cell wall biosynthesis
VHICLISVEIFAWGKYGGFGKATRILGLELVKRGFQVSAIVPRRKSQKEIEDLDGITVYGYDIFKPRETARVFQRCNADIYHSQEPSFGTFLAQLFHPQKKHIVTFRDTRNFSDWAIEFSHPSKNRLQVLANIIFEDNFLVHKAVRRADARFAASDLLIERSYRKYHLKEKPSFLPTPVNIPDTIVKDRTPTVCYISRWDRRKRPELFINLARVSPEIHFIAVGASRDPVYDRKIRSQLEKLQNVEVHGVINQFESDELQAIFARSWILVNTAAREGLPVSFLEACASRCAILSSVNPDGFASRFGYVVEIDDFSKGLDSLLKNDTWREAGTKGFTYIQDTFSVESTLPQHIDIYKKILNQKNEETYHRET